MPGLAAWAAIKGIQVVGTGDFTHPEWFAEITRSLEEAEPGFFKLKKDIENDFAKFPPGFLPPVLSGVHFEDVRFVLTSEISSIYKRHDRVRKVHNILFAPDFASVQRINATLAGIGNLESDGRPILGLDSEKLLEIVLEKASEGFLVPAHIWTPWFSLFGSKSGFDKIEDCFGSLTRHIFALETGLSSDPAMNRQISALDRFTLISNSDCHSPAKLGREANIFATDFNFYAMREAMRSPLDDQGRQVFTATVEFFPEEGKYHCDGHRKCNICFEPAESASHKGVCPKCGKPLTIGVLNRVMELADRQTPVFPKGSPAVFSLIPLPEVLSELYGVGSASKKVMTAYGALIQEFGSEFDILLNVPREDLAARGSNLLAEAVERMRSGNVICKPGYDGEFGVITVFDEKERAEIGGQLNLFGITPVKKKRRSQKKTTSIGKKSKNSAKNKKDRVKAGPNPNQQAAIEDTSRHVLVNAGPGTGKTYTLVQRLLLDLSQKDSPCTVITFTNKAAKSVEKRVLEEAPQKKHRCFISTFHSYCLYWLHKKNPQLRPAGPGTRKRVLHNIFPQTSKTDLQSFDRELSHFLHNYTGPHGQCPSHLLAYFKELDRKKLVDLDAVVPLAIALLDKKSSLRDTMLQETGNLFIDEFQDINPAQYTLVTKLAASNSVFAIGDPDQAIYGFRDSRPDLFYAFQEKSNASVHNLEINYRNSSDILNASSQLIACNQSEHARVRFIADNKEEGRIFFQKLHSAKEEAVAVVKTVEQLLGGTSHREVDHLDPACMQEEIALQDIAVLYRTGKQAELIGAAFAKQGIPCQVVDLVPYFQQPPVRAIYLWLLCMTGNAEKEQFLELLSLEKGFGKKRLLELEQVLPDTVLNFFEHGARNCDALTATVKQRMHELVQLAEKVCQEIETHGIANAVQLIGERYQLEIGTAELQRFCNNALSFSNDLPAFVSHLLGSRDQVVYDENAEAVTLMTLHAAKGLEFPVVLITGTEEGLIPLEPRKKISAEELEEHIEEERRLFYVGMTRASRQLYLMCSDVRKRHGRQVATRPSRFLDEIDKNLLQNVKLKPRKRRSTAKQLRLF